MADRVEAVQRMQDYIDGHLSELISIADLAREAYFSPWHSARIFKELTGLSPADYIRRMRLSRSALKLRDENVKVVEAAMDAGFESVDGYQRAFFKEFGCNPKNYAVNPVPLPLFTAYGVKYRELIREDRIDMKDVKNIFIKTVEKPERKVILKRGIKAADYFSYCDEVGCDVWGILTSIKSISGEPVCLWLPERYRTEGTSEYVQGVEVEADYDGAVPDGFDIISLPAAKYLMFQGEPFKEEDYCEAIQLVQEAIDRYNPVSCGCVWDDENPRIQLEPIGTRGYIELKAVK